MLPAVLLSATCLICSDGRRKSAGFKSLRDTCADTTTAHGRLMLTVLGGLAEFERELIRTRTGEGRERAKARGVVLPPPFGPGEFPRPNFRFSFRTRAESLRASRFNSLRNLIFHGTQVGRRVLQFCHANLFQSLDCRSMMRGKAALSAGEVIQ
jgi:hypothetical protein